MATFTNQNYWGVTYIYDDTEVSLYVYVMPFLLAFGHSKESLILFVSGILFTMPFCYTKLNSMRTMGRMVHGVGACVVNALCMIRVNKGGENI